MKDRLSALGVIQSHGVWPCCALIIVATLQVSQPRLAALEDKFTFFDRLPANNNDVATIIQEVEGPALSRELLHEQELKGDSDTKKKVVVRCTPFVEPSEPKEWINLKLEISGLAEPQDELLSRMMETYINSRTLGMTPRLSAERAFLRHRTSEKGVAAHLRQPSHPDLEAIRKQLAFPPELLVESEALEFVFGKKRDGVIDYLLPDGDLFIFVRMHPEFGWETCLPLDRRLLTHPLVRSEFEKMQTQIAARSSKIADDLGIRPQDKYTISAELKLYWRAMRELFAERGWNMLSVDASPDYQMRLQFP